MQKKSTKPKRIPVDITEEQEILIHKLMKMENRSRAYIATMVFADGLKLVTDPKTIYDNVSMGNKLHEMFISEACTHDWKIANYPENPEVKRVCAICFAKEVINDVDEQTKA